MEHKLNLLDGETYRSYYAPWEKLHNSRWVPTQPGIYSWHVRIPRSLQGSDHIGHVLEDLFTHSHFKASLRGNLGLRYDGILTREVKEPPLQTDLFRELLVMLPWPLYIGLSGNLNERLTSHKRELLAFLDGRLIDSFDTLETVDLDTDRESTYFALRLGKFLRGRKVVSPDMLYVRFAVPEQCRITRCDCRSTDDATHCFTKTMTEIKRAEHVANRLFTPIFGRR